MVRKYNNPIIKGEYTTKVYFLAYSRSITFTEMGKIIDNIKPNAKIQDPSNKTTTGISRAIKKLLPDYLEHKDGKYFSKTEPLLEELERIFKDAGVELNEQEKKILFALLDSNELRSFIDLIIETKPNEDIDGAAAIIEILVKATSAIKPLKKNFFEGIEFSRVLDAIKNPEIVEIMKAIPDHLKRSQILSDYGISSDINFNPNLVLLLLAMPDDLIAKISKLDDTRGLIEVLSKAVSNDLGLKMKLVKVITG